MNLEKVIKLAQQITFTTFLILCVAVMGYAVTRLYTDSRTDWDRIQLNSQKLELLDEDIALLIQRINRLIDLLNGSYVPGSATPQKPGSLWFNLPNKIPNMSLSQR